MLPGPDDEPIPITYTLDTQRTHRVSVVDVDARDTRMLVYVDNVLRGETSDFVLNKTADCGTNPRDCVMQGWSTGVVVVPPGKHEVKIQWSGKGAFCGRD